MTYKEFNEGLDFGNFPNGISAYCIFYNPGKRWETILKAVKPFVEELILVGQETNTEACEIAKKYSTQYWETSCKGFPEPDRQPTIDKCKYRWILTFDSDELISSPLMKFIRERFIKQTKYDGLKVQEISLFDDKQPHFEYCTKHLMYRKQGTLIKPVLHSQIEGVKNNLDMPQLVVLHYQGSAEKQISKCDRYDKVADKLFEDGLISKEELVNKKGINSQSRGAMER